MENSEGRDEDEANVEGFEDICINVKSNSGPIVPAESVVGKLGLGT